MKLFNSLCTLGYLSEAKTETYTGRSYKSNGHLRFKISDGKQSKALQNLENEFQFDWLAPHEGPDFSIGTDISIVTDPADTAPIIKALKKAGADLVIDNHLDDLIKAQFSSDRTKQSRTGFEFDVYHTLDEINAFLLNTVDNAAGASVTSIGKSVEDREIYRVDIGNKNMPKIIIDCGIHAREWASPAFCLYVIDQLLSGSYTAWPDKFHFVMYPLLNPDGYRYTWTNERLWRKNRAANNGSSCKGVDLNRNYDAEWMNAGSSQNQCSSVYAGTGPFSEPESQAQRDDMLSLDNKLAYLTYHAYSEFIIYPYSSSYSAEAHNKGELDMVASQMVANIEQVHGKRYQYGEGANAFYPASGGSDDWSHNKANIDLSFTIELRDTGTYAFLLPENQLIPNGEENMEGIRAVIDHISDGLNYTTCDECHANAECVYNGSRNEFECQCKDEFSGDGGQDCSNGTVDQTIRDSVELSDENSSFELLYCTALCVMLLYVS